MLARVTLRAVAGLRHTNSGSLCAHACRTASTNLCVATNVSAVRRLHISNRLHSETYYTATHEWIKVDGDLGTVGITDHAQDKLGDIVFVELPEVGQVFEKGDVFAVVESVKAASDINIPAGGKIVEVNEALGDDPGLVNKSAMGDGWIAKVSLSDPEDVVSSMDLAAYEKMVKSDPNSA